MRINAFIGTIIIGVVFCSNGGYAQNLVVNPSFEEILDCPYGGGEIVQAFPWISDTRLVDNDTVREKGSVDLFHRCDSVPRPPLFNAPLNGLNNNYGGSSEPHTGHGYAHSLSGHSFSSLPQLFVEVAVGKLNTPLIGGEKYVVKFFVKETKHRIHKFFFRLF